jgi:hypothetical protein
MAILPESGDDAVDGDRERVLDMLRAGKITGVQADQLLRQLGALPLANGEKLHVVESRQALTHDDFASSATPMTQVADGANYTVDELICLSAHDVDPAYVSAVRNAGYADLPLEEVIEMHAREVDPTVLARFHHAGLDDLTVDEIIEMNAHEVAPNYIVRLRKAGYSHLPLEQIRELAIHEVDPEYLTLLRDAGLADLPFDTLLACGMHQVDVAQLHASIRAQHESN